MAVKNLFTVICACGLLFVCIKAQEYQLVIVSNRLDNNDHTPGVNSNRLTLACRHIMSSQLIENPLFWVNNTQQELRERLGGEGNYFEPQNTELFFTLTPELEGGYFCGPNPTSISSSIVLIVYPLPDLFLMPSTITAFAGRSAVLSPLVSPGVFLKQYYIYWRNASNSVTLAQIRDPRHQNPLFKPDERYTLNPDTFALNISSVRFEDRGPYRGVLGVMDPAGSSFVYEQTETLNITLEVYILPSFIEPELPSTPVIVDSRSNSTNFTCIVEGFPKPTTEWRHDTTTVETGNKYRIQERVISRDPFVVESILTIMGLASEDSGNVTCVATVTVDGQSHVDRRTFQLSVLGKLDTIITFITVRQRVILRVHLLQQMSATVQLHIQYSNTETGGTRNITTSDSFSAQSEELVYFDDDPTLASQFKHFTVAVALVSGSVVGPFHHNLTVHDLFQPTELYDFLSMHVLPWCGGLLALLILVIFAIIVLCVCACRKGWLKCCVVINTPGAFADVIDGQEKKFISGSQSSTPSTPTPGDVACAPPPPSIVEDSSQTKLQCTRSIWQKTKLFFLYLTCSCETEKEKAAKEKIKQLFTNRSNEVTNNGTAGSPHRRIGIEEPDTGSLSSAGMTGSIKVTSI